ncbi:hypothetical protein [Kocuria sp.]|uniref:hypothetical protein n=1 Tax=Kocuria sp. TaxID=1871328 RepID=UPI0026DF3201|nr:hypothetical protein [Kocuria sp.]MDO5619563.1 hypothetical protein [Kocuria sp.]
MHDYDQQLLESIGVRRNRLVAAVLYGPNRSRRNFTDLVRTFLIGLIIAALIATGCVAASFVTTLFERERERRDQQQQPQPTVTQTVPVQTQAFPEVNQVPWPNSLHV